ncbi:MULTISPECIES: tetratricopeptide repeat protein [Streptomyces]|uniref:tetratricopeptide repeat protein n=1 Tax=Streptomyces TaxID=1883 RepID=UPI001E301507|nr:tetratricopeptide repeat protein [Streptomyces sp. DH20]MCP9991310.1 tetratricopeptide repeat protein [Streptomyces albogriseolus]
MSRLSREKKREEQQAAEDAANSAAVPVDVRVPADGSGEPGAYVDGVRVIAGPGEEIQQAVLNRLHRIAVASGHAVHATVRDERIGYVVPLRVAPDGSSAFAAQPVQLRGTRDRGQAPSETPAPGMPPAPKTPRGPAPQSPPAEPDTDRPTHLLRPVPESEAPWNLRPASASEAAAASASAPGSEVPAAFVPVPASEAPAASGPAAPEPDAPAAPGAPPASGAPESGPPAPPTPVRDATPTFPPHPVPGTGTGCEASFDSPPTFRLRRITPPGTVAPPTGVFGPPPDMDARPHPAERDTATGPTPAPDLAAALDADPDPRPTPPRGFDAVAEAVLGDEPAAPAGSPLADPMERINDAVRKGRIDTAARLADETLEHASATLGAEHPEVLRLRELTAYIAYLAGEPVRAFRLSLDLAVVCRRAGDAEAAYGNVRSAATAWRGVRDPLLGLELGRDLVALWTELASEGGPAADEEEELDSAHARMDRLTARARGMRG